MDQDFLSRFRRTRFTFGRGRRGGPFSLRSLRSNKALGAAMAMRPSSKLGLKWPNPRGNGETLEAVAMSTWTRQTARG